MYQKNYVFIKNPKNPKKTIIPKKNHWAGFFLKKRVFVEGAIILSFLSIIFVSPALEAFEINNNNEKRTKDKRI